MADKVNAYRTQLIALLPRLRRFATALSGSSSEADDLVQSAVERALVHVDKWQEGTRLDSWMFRIIQNLWKDEIGAHRRRSVDLDQAMDVVGDDGRTTTSNRSDLVAVRDAMAQLPADQRAVLCLVVVDGLSYDEAASILSIPVGTVMSRLARARARVLSIVGDERPNLKVVD